MMRNERLEIKKIVLYFTLVFIWPGNRSIAGLLRRRDYARNRPHPWIMSSAIPLIPHRPVKILGLAEGSGLTTDAKLAQIDRSFTPNTISSRRTRQERSGSKGRFSSLSSCFNTESFTVKLILARSLKSGYREEDLEKKIAHRRKN